MLSKKIQARGLLFSLVAALFWAGCSGGGGGNSSFVPTAPQTPTSGGGTGTGTAGATGDVSVSVTDAPTDQIERFEVDVTSINLTRANGANVAVLPATTRVDFAELITVSQLLTTFAVPNGSYTGVSVTMDFTSADVLVTGNTASAKVTDEHGKALTGAVTRDIKFDPSRPLVVAPGLMRFVEIDFDLDASCAIDVQANTVALGPVLRAEAHPTAPKVTRIAGVIASVDSQAQSFVVEIKSPFQAASRPKVTVTTTNQTHFVVDGIKSNFAALAAKPLGSPVFAHGNLDPASKSFAATLVEAWVAGDGARGHVVSRTVDGVLTVKGAAVDLVNGSRLLNQTLTIDAKNAKIMKRGAQGPLKTDDIGVGQHIVARGKLTGASLVADHVVLIETGIFGLAKGPVVNGVLTIDLMKVGGKPVAEFNFTVGALATADPKSYTIGTSTLNLANITSGTPVGVRGLISAYNAPAATPEAIADAVIDRTNVTAQLFVGWPNPTQKPFVSSSSTDVVLSLVGTGRRFVDPGNALVVFAETDKPKVVSDASPKGFMIVERGGRVTMHATFAAWQADILTKLATAKVRFFSATGKWDQTALTMTAKHAAIMLD